MKSKDVNLVSSARGTHSFKKLLAKTGRHIFHYFFLNISLIFFLPSLLSENWRPHETSWGLFLTVPQMPSAGAMRSGGPPGAPASPGTAVGGGQESASFCRSKLAGEHQTCQAARCHPSRRAG